MTREPRVNPLSRTRGRKRGNSNPVPSRSDGRALDEMRCHDQPGHRRRIDPGRTQALQRRARPFGKYFASFGVRLNRREADHRIADARSITNERRITIAPPVVGVNGGWLTRRSPEWLQRANVLSTAGTR